MSDRSKHWAWPLRTAPAGTLEAWIYLAACTVICRQGQEAEHEARCREIGAYAYENRCSIWHACWATTAAEKRRPCCCVPCANARGERWSI